MQVLNHEQGSLEWIESRLGIVTMSELSPLLVKGKGDNGLGAGAITYLHELIGERITGEPANQFSGNANTERGHEFEPIAYDLYQERTGNVVDHVGIILNHDVGYSPDGLIAHDGLIEIKSKLPKLLCQVILDGEIPKEHMAQCQGGLWVSEREWIDFIAYWPGMPLFVKRAYRDEKMISDIQDAVKRFYDELDRRMDLIIKLAA